MRPIMAHDYVAEIHNQVNMMIGHEIFDPENWEASAGRSRIHSGRWGDYKAGNELARQQTGCVETQPRYVYGSGRHNESPCCSEPASSKSCTVTVALPVRVNHVPYV